MIYYIISGAIIMPCLYYNFKLRKENEVLYEKLTQYDNMEYSNKNNNLYYSNVSSYVSSTISNITESFFTTKNTIMSKISDITINKISRDTKSESDLDKDKDKDNDFPLFKEYEYRDDPRNVKVSSMKWNEKNGYGYLDLYTDNI
jgi:hypothetical protein